MIEVERCTVPSLGRWVWTVQAEGWYDSGLSRLRAEAIVRAHVTLWMHRVLRWTATTAGRLHLRLRHHVRTEKALYSWGLPTSPRKKSGR